MVNKPKNIFVMVCSNWTEDWCLNNSILATVDDRKNLIEDIQVGDEGFLYNYSTDELIGRFRAITLLGKFLIKTEGQFQRYPWQFKIELVGKEITRIPNGYVVLKQADVEIVESTPTKETAAKTRSIKIPGESLLPVDGENIKGRKLLTLFETAYNFSNYFQKTWAEGAVSQIMGRNLSHNIGSHVLSYRLDKHENFGKSIADNYQVIKLMHAIKEDKDLFEYLKHRMDFLAQIATMNPVWMATRMFCIDILIPFIQQKFLLNNIVLSEGMHRDRCDSSECKALHSLMCFEVFADDKLILKASFEDEDPDNIGFYFNDIFEDQIDDLIIDDVPVAIPHGIMGSHAFYCILENLLRNSAKHGALSKREKNPFTITCLIDTKTYNDFVLVTVRDNMGNCNKNIIQTIQQGLNEKLTDASGQTTVQNWGLKEMLISTNFIRMGSTSDLFLQNNNVPEWSKEANDLRLDILTPHCGVLVNKDITSNNICEECENPFLAYRFYFLKPKEVVNVKICAVSSKEFYMKDQKSNNVYGLPHRFMIITNKQKELLKEIDVALLPYRIINDENGILINSSYSHFVELEDMNNFYELEICDSNSSKALSICYESWLKSNYGLENFPLVIHRDTEVENKNAINELYITKKVYDICQPTRETIVFDRHGENIQHFKNNDKVIYYQPYTGSEPTYRLLSNMPKDEEKARIRVYELIEAGITRILIADERIWHKAEKADKFPTTGSSMPLAYVELFELMNIFFVPLTDNRIKISTLENYLLKHKPHFIIVHQGLRDKINTDDLKELDSLVQKQVPYYIITSGRGRTHELPKHARFLEFSTLKQLLDERDKFGLVQTLFSLRKAIHV